MIKGLCFNNNHLTLWTVEASVASLAHKIPTLFSCLSKKPISCDNMALKVFDRNRFVRFSPDIPNIPFFKHYKYISFIITR